MFESIKQLLPKYPHIRSDFFVTGMLLHNACLRKKIAHWRFKFMGEGAKIDARVNIQFANNISLGKKVKIQNGSYLMAGPTEEMTIDIDDYTLLGGNVHIFTSIYNVDKDLKDYIRNYPPRVGPVKIGKGVFIGWNSIILPGVKIGDEAIIKPFSVVGSHVAAKTLFVPKKKNILER
ncbi:MAG: hypothetical protein JW827_01770 [Spirochaetes bacterium]|nr:hypothetical protein [Spirochaetota bacterium]